MHFGWRRERQGDQARVATFGGMWSAVAPLATSMQVPFGSGSYTSGIAF